MDSVQYLELGRNEMGDLFLDNIVYSEPMHDGDDENEKLRGFCRVKASFDSSSSLNRESESTSCPIPVRCRPSVPSERSGQALRVISLLAQACFGFSHTEWNE